MGGPAVCSANMDIHTYIYISEKHFYIDNNTNNNTVKNADMNKDINTDDNKDENNDNDDGDWQ